MFGRFAIGLPKFLREPIPPEQCPAILRSRLVHREQSFLSLIRKAVYENPSSPYLKLLRAAKIEYEAVSRLVNKDGIEATLGLLFDEGVYVTLEEFKGRHPIRRAGLEVEVKARYFDNPLLVSHFEGSTGASRGGGTRLIVDLDLIAEDALAHSLFLQSFRLESSPMAIWRPLPPGVAGIKKLFMQAKLGKSMERWFSQNQHRLGLKNLKSFLFVSYALHASRILGTGIPTPEFTPVDSADRVAGWLARKAAQGSPGHLDTNATCGVRALLAAKETGLDIAGSFLRFGGEPYTITKAKLVDEAGCRAASHYSMSEVGTIGIACADATELDDVHLISSKMAVLQRSRMATNPLHASDAFYLTTIAPICPKIMLNVACGDNGVIVDRECSCPLGQAGFNRHIHSIRSYEKLTSEGMHFLGSDLLRLLEHILPSQFGGGPTDYQFVESEEAGLTKVRLLASPRLGPLDEKRLVESVLEFLGSRAPENRMMVERWQEGQTLQVKRSEPHVTSAAKLLPLHVLPKE